MALAAMRVPTIFTAVDRFSDVVNRMTNSTRVFSTSASAAAMRTSRMLNQTGGAMLNNGAAIAIGFGLAVNEAVKYEKAIASLAAVTATKVGSMNADIEDLAMTSKRSVIDIAKGFENVGSKMSEYLKNPVALKEITKQAILMADASGMSIDESTENLTSLLNQFKLSYLDANTVVNKLSAGEDIGASKIPESVDMIRQFASSARMAGADFEETVALIQSTTKTLGVLGVGRSFRNLMVDLNTGEGMDKNKKRALAMVGADLKKIINPATKFSEKLEEIKKLLSKKQAMGMFFKKTGFEVGATFLESFKMYEDYLDFTRKNNTAQEKANKNNATLSKQMMDLKNIFSLLAIKIGTHLLPKLHEFVDVMIPIIKKTMGWVKQNDKLIKAVFKLTIALLILGALAKIGAFLFFSYSKALIAIELATIAYTEAVWFLGLSFEGMAVATTYAVAGLWATLYPLALIGLAVWAVVDMVQHWEDWHDIIALCVGPLGCVYLLLDKIIKHSDNIGNKFAFEGWKGGLRAIGTLLEDVILSPLIGALKIMGRLTSFIPGVGSSFSEMANDLNGLKTPIASDLTITPLGMLGEKNLTTYGGVMPKYDITNKENLAGDSSSLVNAIAKAMSIQTIDLNVNDPSSVLNSVVIDGKSYTGAPKAKTDSTTGVKN